MAFKKEKIIEFYKIQKERLKMYEQNGTIHKEAKIEAECLYSTLHSLEGFFPQLKNGII